MKSINKILKFVVLPLVVLVVVLLLAFYLVGEGILKSAVGKAASKTLGVGVHIDDMNLSILKGRVGIGGLIVENPSGYANKNLLELDKGQVTASIGSLLSDTVNVKTIQLDGVNLVIEQKGLGNNLRDIIKALPAEDKQQDEQAGKKLHIDELEITNIKVRVKLLPVPGKADTVSLNLDPIKMSNLGSDNKLSTGKLCGKIMLALASGVVKQGAGILPDDITNSMKSALEETLALTKTASEEGKKLIEKGGELTGGLKGLLKSKKDE